MLNRQQNFDVQVWSKWLNFVNEKCVLAVKVSLNQLQWKFYCHTFVFEGIFFDKSTFKNPEL